MLTSRNCDTFSLSYPDCNSTQLAILARPYTKLYITALLPTGIFLYGDTQVIAAFTEIPIHLKRDTLPVHLTRYLTKIAGRSKDRDIEVRLSALRAEMVSRAVFGAQRT